VNGSCKVERIATGWEELWKRVMIFGAISALAALWAAFKLHVVGGFVDQLSGLIFPPNPDDK